MTDSKKGCLSSNADTYIAGWLSSLQFVTARQICASPKELPSRLKALQANQQSSLDFKQLFANNRQACS